MKQISGNITLHNVSDGYQLFASPSSIAVPSNYDGTNPILSDAIVTIRLSRAGRVIPFTIEKVEATTQQDEWNFSFNPNQNTIRIVSIPSTSHQSTVNVTIKFILDGVEIQEQTSFSVGLVRSYKGIDWVDDWNGTKTQVGSTYVVSPKMFVGTKTEKTLVSGTYIGSLSNFIQNSSFPTNSGHEGLYGYKNGKMIFYLDNTGAKIGGWEINENSIFRGVEIDQSNVFTNKSSDITIGSNGLRGYKWRLESNGSGALAGGNISWDTSGNADFQGKITTQSGNIAGWNIAADAIHKDGAIISSKDKLVALANTSDKASLQVVRSKGGVAMYYTSSSDYGFVGYKVGDNNTTINTFSVGSNNNIAGWSFDGDSIYRGGKKNEAGTYTSQSGNITIGSNGIRGHKWYLDADGSGSLAGGNIMWTREGKVSFSSSVSLLWKSDIEREIDLSNEMNSGRMLFRNPTFEGGVGGMNVRKINRDKDNTTAYRFSDNKLVIQNYGYIDGSKVIQFSMEDEQHGVPDVYDNRVYYACFVADLPVGSKLGVSTYNIITKLNLQVDWLTGNLGEGVKKKYIARIQIPNSQQLKHSGSTINVEKDESGSHYWNPLHWRDIVFYLEGVAGTRQSPYQATFYYATVFDSSQKEGLYTKITREGIYTGSLRAEQIEAGFISSSRIQAGSITADKIDVSSLKAKIVDAAEIVSSKAFIDAITSRKITTEQITIGSITSDLISADAISGTHIQDGVITSEKIQALAISAAKIQSGAITADKIATKAISADKIQVGAIDGTKIQNNSIYTQHLKSNSITTEKLSSFSVTSEKIRSGAITADKIHAGAITADKIQSGVISSSHIQSNSITSDKIKAGAITADKIQSGVISSSHIQSNSITSDKIKAGAITADKIDVSGLSAKLIEAGVIRTDYLQTNLANIKNGAVIGGWTIDNSGKLYVGGGQMNIGTRFANDGVIMSPEGFRGKRFKLESDGSGSLAGNGIWWDTEGNLNAHSIVISGKSSFNGKLDGVIGTFKELGSTSGNGTKLNFYNTWMAIGGNFLNAFKGYGESLFPTFYAGNIRSWGTIGSMRKSTLVLSSNDKNLFYSYFHNNIRHLFGTNPSELNDNNKEAAIGSQLIRDAVDGDRIIGTQIVTLTGARTIDFAGFLNNHIVPEIVVLYLHKKFTLAFEMAECQQITLVNSTTWSHELMVNGTKVNISGRSVRTVLRLPHSYIAHPYWESSYYNDRMVAAGADIFVGPEFQTPFRQ